MQSRQLELVTPSTTAPRVVRNWWAECKVEGRQATLADGARSKDGGIRIEIMTHHNSIAYDAMTIEDHASGNNLQINIYGPNETRIAIIPSQDQTS